MAFQYKVAGNIVSLQVDDSLVAVRFREPAPLAVRTANAARLGVVGPQQRIELPGEKFTIYPATNMARSMPFGPAAAVAGAVDVVRVSPVFRVGDKLALVTDRIIIGFKPEVPTKEVHYFLARHGYAPIEEFDGAFVVRLPESEDPFKTMAWLESVDSVQFTEPDLVTVGSHTPRPGGAHRNSESLRMARGELPGRSAAGDDPLLSRQYAMEITQARAAWAWLADQQVDLPDMTIAILDEGVDRHHEDLNIVGEYDATGMDLDQQPNDWDGHGTACAGLAAATGGNELGVRGVASGFPILAVRLALSSAPGASWTTTNATIARAIDWSWQNGADVLSNSWGGGAPSNLIAAAFERARTQGRGGKGCVIVIAAGNDNRQIGFPATLPNLMVVTASNEFDEPKTPTSRDGEHWWGSSFGSEAWIAAPGVHNYTTDISSSAGYSRGGADDQNRPYNANYTPDFNGTSSATPIVAGAAALLLSLHSELREHEVRDVLRNSADKVGANYDSNGHNVRMGYGRLNVHSAIERIAGRMRRPTPTAGNRWSARNHVQP